MSVYKVLHPYILFSLICLSAKYESAPIPPETPSSPAPINAINFMKKYGYLVSGPTDSEALYTEAAIIDALKTLQRFGNIPITGVFDNATLKLIQSPRCGVSDVINPNKERRKRYIIGSDGWKKREITYFVANWSPKLGEEAVTDEIERAFDTWSGYSRINFKLVNDPNADIVIAFGRGPHGDGYPFDGTGNILAHAFFPYEMGTYGGDIHFDDDENWMIRPNDPYEGTDFFTVAVHELGHSLGLAHSTVPSSTMFPYYKGYSSNFQLDYDDILGMYQLYISRTLEKNEPSRDSNKEDEEDEEGEEESVSSGTTDSIEETTRENDETTTVIISTSTTERSQGVTFEGDYETVDEHRQHERNKTNNGTSDVPNICEGSYDSISLFGNEIFIFKEQYVWRFQTRGNIESGYPVNFHQLFHGIPKNVTRIDASYQRHTDGNIIFFTGNVYWMYNGNTVTSDSPRPLTDYGIPGDVEKIDAVQVWAKNRKTYLYRFWRFDDTTRTLDPGYPQNIGKRWRGLPRDIDTAMTSVKGITYFFKNNLFWRFDNTLIKTDDRYPLPASQFWFAC